MVLPAPAPAARVSSIAPEWIEDLFVALRLRPPPVSLLVVDASDTWLPWLVRALHAQGQRPRVCTSLRSLFSTEPGEVVLFAPPEREFAVLNELRPRVVERGVSLVYWFASERARAFRLQAPDAADLVAQTFRGTKRHADHVDANIRCAATRGRSNIVWTGTSDVAAALARVFDSPRIVRAPSRTAATDLVRSARCPPSSWLVWNPADARARRRIRWALAEAGRARRTIIEAHDGAREPGWWTINETSLSLDDTAQIFEHEPDETLAVACGLEPDACALAAALLRAGAPAQTLRDGLLVTEDPGAVVGALADDMALIDRSTILHRSASAPVLRGCLSRLRVEALAWAQRSVGVATAVTEVANEALTAWAARPNAVTSPTQLLEPTSRGALHEAALRHDPRPWSALALSASLLGHQDFAEHYAMMTDADRALEADEETVVRLLRREVLPTLDLDAALPDTAFAEQK